MALGLIRGRAGGPRAESDQCRSSIGRPVLILFLPAAGLESIVGYCVGCRISGLLMRAGVIPEGVCAECADISGRLRWAT